MRIDWWTLALQTVNVLVLIWILSRFFFRPMSEIISRRQEQIAQMLADANNFRHQAREELISAEQTRATIEASRQEQIEKAKSEARRQRSELLAQAATEIAKLHAEANNSIAHDRASMEQAVIARARSLAVDIARHLIERVSPVADIDPFLKSICSQIQKLSPQLREACTKLSGQSEEIEVTTARELQAAECERIRSALEQVFETALPLKFHQDPEVIAGIELNSSHAAIRSSWREDLDVIRAELSRDAKA